MKWIRRKRASRNGPLEFDEQGLPGVRDGPGRHRNGVEEALRESESRLSHALEAGELGIWSLDTKTGKAWRSLRHDQIFGYDTLLPEWTYQMFLEHVLPEDRKEVDEKFGHALATGAQWSFECRIKRPDGAIRWIWGQGRPKLNDQNEVVQLVGLVRDITRSKQEEEKLTKLNEELDKLNRIRKALRTSSQAMARTVDETEYLNEVCKIVVEDCGHAMVWIGYAEDDENKTVRPVTCSGFEEGYLETLNLTWADTERGRGPTGTAIRTGKPSVCKNMQTDPKFKPWREEAIKRGYASSVVLPLMADGKAFGAISIYSREPDPFSEDEVKLLTELAEDLAFGITAIRMRIARVKSEEALKQSEERFRTMANSIPQLAWIARADGHIYWYNQRWYDYTGTTPQQMEGWGWQSVHDPVELPRVLERWKAALAEGQPWEDTFPLRRYDGAMRWHLSRAIPIRNEQGQIERWFGTNTDITDRRIMEEELKQAKDAAEAANRAKSQFFANISHDLRTPMNAILGMTELALGEANDPSIRDYLQTAKESANVLLELLNEVLDLSRMEAGKFQLESAPFNLRATLGQTLKILEMRAHEKGLQLACAVADDVPGRPGGRSHAPPPGVDEPGGQRRQVYRAGRGKRPHRCPLKIGQGRATEVSGARHGHRHFAGRPGKDLRSLHPGRGLYFAHLRRHGLGPDYRLQPGGTDGRANLGRKPIGTRQQIPLYRQAWHRNRARKFARSARMRVFVHGRIARGRQALAHSPGRRQSGQSKIGRLYP